jgi:hypothetical protein
MRLIPEWIIYSAIVSSIFTIAIHIWDAKREERVNVDLTILRIMILAPAMHTLLYSEDHILDYLNYG